MEILFEQYEEELIRLRRAFHQIPEIAFMEEKTSKKIKDYLKEIGITEIKTYAKTGVSAVIRGREEGPCVGVRMDMDALPITEETNLPFASIHAGKMHACGHDGHIAMNLILAKILWDQRNNFSGAVKLIFQPAEEGAGGAEPMIEEGVLSDPQVDWMLGGHLWPDVATGKIDFTYGAAFAASDKIIINIHGQGGHGAMPHQVKDAMEAGCRIVLALKELSKKYKKEGQRHTLSICSFDCVSAYNIFRSDAKLKGTLRTINEAFRSQIIEEIKRISQEIFQSMDLSGEVEIHSEYPALVNHAETLNLLMEATKEMLGQEAVVLGEATMGAEDFAYFSKACPSAHIKIGSALPTDQYPLHHAKYNINEAGLLPAVKVLTQGVLKLLAQEKGTV